MRVDFDDVKEARHRMARRLLAVFEDSNLTHHELANMAGISRSSVAEALKGGPISVDTLLRVSLALGVSWEEPAPEHHLRMEMVEGILAADIESTVYSGEYVRLCPDGKWRPWHAGPWRTYHTAVMFSHHDEDGRAIYRDRHFIAVRQDFTPFIRDEDLL